MFLTLECKTDLIRHCWGLIKPIRQFQDTNNKIYLSSVEDAFDKSLFETCSSPIIETELDPYPDPQPEARPNHNSLTTDKRTPRILVPKEPNMMEFVQEVPVYAPFVWPYLFVGSQPPVATAELKHEE